MKGHTVHWKLCRMFCTEVKYVYAMLQETTILTFLHIYTGLLRVLDLKLIISNCKKCNAKNSYNILVNFIVEDALSVRWDPTLTIVNLGLNYCFTPLHFRSLENIMNTDLVCKLFLNE